MEPRGSGWGISHPKGSSFPAVLQCPVSRLEDKLPLDQMGAGCLWGEGGGKDSAPLTLSLWNSLTQELWKLNVATLVGMQTAADVDAHEMRAAERLQPHSCGHTAVGRVPRKPLTHLLEFASMSGLQPLPMTYSQSPHCPFLIAGADHGEGIALFRGLRLPDSPTP